MKAADRRRADSSVASSDPWAQRYGFALSLGVLAAIVLADFLLPSSLVISGSFSIAAVVAAATTTVWRTALVAGLAIGMAGVSAVWNHNFATQEWRVRVVLAAILGALAVLLAGVRTRREARLRQMTLIAETAQRALLRAMPTAVGSIGLAARYVSATEAALVGGDLYEVAESPYGVRVIVGDVRGKGLDAVQLASTVLAAFRRSAFAEPELTEVADELDKVVSAVCGEEDFVTALLAEFHNDQTVTLVNCGHHPPLLVTETEPAALLDTGEPEPPLGLGPRPHPVTAAWPDHTRMLIYTDGLVETRDRRGIFFPLGQYAAVLRGGNLEQALDTLLSRLVDYAGHRLNDDLAVILAEHRPS